jgi:predicted transposase YdaD
VGDMDQGIKRLIQTYPQDVLALVLPGATYEGPCAIDVATEPQLVLDTLLQIHYQGVECAVDIEAESYPRPDMGRRLFDYAARARIVTGLPVISVVLWLNAGGPPPPSPYELRVGDLLLGTWRFFGIEVYRLPAIELFNRGLVGLLPLVPFTADASDVGAIERAADLIKNRTAGAELQELEALLTVFAARTIGVDTAESIIGRLFMSTEILETSPLYQELLARGRAKGREEGIALGLREAVLSVLRGRFGEPASELVEALARASTTDLQEIVALAATGTLEDVRARLGL